MAGIPPIHIAAYAKNAGFPDSDLATVTAIALAESGGMNNAISPTDDHGVWQINKPSWPQLFKKYNWNSPSDNARMAYDVYQQQGLSAWVTYDNGSYQQHMSAARTAVQQLNVRLASGESLQDIVGEPLSGARTPSDLAPEWLSPLQDFAAFVTDRSNWLRVGYFVLGSVLFGIGAYLLLQQSAVGREVTTKSKAGANAASRIAREAVGNA